MFLKAKKLPAWKQLQIEVATHFSQHGFDVRENPSVRGARATHEVDVLATSRQGPLAPRFVIECKLWKRRLSKAHILTLKQVIEDVGATMGVIVSEKGLQAGAQEFLDAFTNIVTIPRKDLARSIRLLTFPSLLNYSRILFEGEKHASAFHLGCEPEDFDVWPPLFAVNPTDIDLCLLTDKKGHFFFGLGNFWRAKEGQRSLGRVPSDCRLWNVRTKKSLNLSERKKLVICGTELSPDLSDELMVRPFIIAAYRLFLIKGNIRIVARFGFLK